MEQLDQSLGHTKGAVAPSRGESYGSSLQVGVCHVYPEQNFDSTFASREQTLLETRECFLQEILNPGCGLGNGNCRGFHNDICFVT